MLDSVIYARDHHLSSNGILMPNRCKIFLLGHGDEERHRHLISYWNNVYGFDMSCLQKEVLRETSIEVCNPKYILTEPFAIVDLDLMSVDLNYSNFTSEFTLKVITTGKLTSLVGYFDTFFELPQHVEFSTSPHNTATHWKQAVFYLKDAITVNAGDSIPGTIRCRRDPKDARSLVITIDMFGKTMNYNLNWKEKKIFSNFCIFFVPLCQIYKNKPVQRPNLNEKKVKKTAVIVRLIVSLKMWYRQYGRHYIQILHQIRITIGYVCSCSRWSINYCTRRLYQWTTGIRWQCWRWFLLFDQFFNI